MNRITGWIIRQAKTARVALLFAALALSGRSPLLACFAPATVAPSASALAEIALADPNSPAGFSGSEASSDSDETLEFSGPLIVDEPVIVDEPADAPTVKTAAKGECCEPVSPCGAVHLRDQDQLWAVSTAGLGYCKSQLHADHMKFWKYEIGKWVRSSLAAFLASDNADQTTAFYVHGNQISHTQAFANGWTVYGRLVSQAPSPRPLRYVIFIWPADKINARTVEDVRVKAGRTAAQSYYLAWLIDRIDPSVPLSLTGYSFGSRIITGALHLLGGGSAQGFALGSRIHSEQRHASVALIASALDNDWLAPGHCHGRALSQVDQMLLVNNGCDRALKNYWRMYCGARRRSGPQALGYTGVAGLNQMSAFDQAKIRQFDACCIVGTQHDWRLYWGSPSIVGRIVPYVFYSGYNTDLARKPSGKPALKTPKVVGAK